MAMTHLFCGPGPWAEPKVLRAFLQMLEKMPQDDPSVIEAKRLTTRNLENHPSLSNEMLTSSELQSLKRETQERHAYFQKAFAHLRPKPEPKKQNPTE